MMIKKTLLAATLLVFGMTAFSVPAFADDEEEGGEAEVFSVVNSTGEAIDEIYIDAANETEWGEDLTGDESLADGETLELTYDAAEDDEDAEAYDMMIKWAEGYDDGTMEDVWEDLDLKDAHKVTLEYDWEEHHPTATIE